MCKIKKYFYAILKVTFHLQLLQNIDYIPHIIWYILEPILCFSSPKVYILLHMLAFGTEFVLSYGLTLLVCHSYFDKSALSVFTFLKCPSICFYFNIRLFCHQYCCMTTLILDANYIPLIVTLSLSYTQQFRLPTPHPNMNHRPSIFNHWFVLCICESAAFMIY